VEPSASSLNRLQPAALAILRTLLNAALCDQQAPKAAASAGSTQVCEPDAIEQSKRHIAAYHATNPSEESLDYYQRHPEQTHLVKRAHYKLIKDLNDLAKNTDTREVARYLDFNKSHVWMYEEVLTAKSMVEKGQIEELNARYAAQPVLAYFGDAAKFYYGDKSKSTEDTAAPSPPSPEKNDVQLAGAKDPPEMAPTSSVAATTEATPAPAAGPHAPAAGPHAPPGSSNQAPSTSIPVRDPASTTVNPLQQVPTTGGPGHLSAVFHDVSGTYLGEKSWSTRLAANITIDVKGLESGLNLIKLVDDVEAFARELGRTAESPISQALRRAGEELTAYGRAMSDASTEGSQRIPGHGMWPEGYDADISDGEEL